MRTSILIALLALSVFTQTVNGQGAPAARTDQEFQALLARAKRFDPSVDFRLLRRLWSTTPTFSPSHDKAEQPMIAAAEAGRNEEALRLAREILDRDYMNLEAQVAGTALCQALMDMGCAGRHLFLSRGLLDSIRGSGDGRTAATAYVVMAAPEETALVRALGLTIVSQSVMRTADGHAIDVVTTRNAANGRPQTLYFNVDVPLAAAARTSGSAAP